MSAPAKAFWLCTIVCLSMLVLGVVSNDLFARVVFSIVAIIAAICVGGSAMIWINKRFPDEDDEPGGFLS